MAHRYEAAALHKLVENRLRTVLPVAHNDGDVVALAMRHGVLGPGKRLRPLILLAAGGALGRAPSAMLDSACALELVHAASLVLDDLPCMDDAALRRGRATLHRRYGEDVAVLAAFALLSQAFRLLASAPQVDATVRAELVDLLAQAVGTHGLVQGQLRDLRQVHTAVPLEDAAQTNALKTGALFAAAFGMAAALANAATGTRTALHSCAIELGQAFQLRDDLLDAAPASETGKDQHQDQGKLTVLSALDRASATDRLEAHRRHVIEPLRAVLPDPGLLLHVIDHMLTLGADSVAGRAATGVRTEPPPWPGADWVASVRHREAGHTRNA